MQHGFKFLELFKNFIILIILIMTFSCKKKYHDAVIAKCLNGKIFLLKSMTIEDVRSSVERAIYEIKTYEYNLEYTLISNGKESMMLEKIKPEDFKKCQLEEVNYKNSYKFFLQK